MTTSTLPPGHFAPRPGRAAASQLARAATGQEIRILLRNSEQLLLSFVIPIAALIGMTTVQVGALPDPRIHTVTPGIFALAIMSASFASPAILTGFDRRYGVLKRLAATGFPKWLLLASKSAAACAIIVVQLALLSTIAATAFGWRPSGSVAWVPLLAVLGAASFMGLALLLGGTLRAEATLGLANIVWLALIGLGGVLIPLSSAPHWLQTVGGLTPAGALANGLRAVLTHGAGPGWANIAILTVWLLLGWAATVRWFKWH